ncbi:TetR/AcrR family transcriptional regulator [Pollutimonas bauzanensis]|uniref:Transcriptional regulator, TetR family n=1 Tax=Pollutimonas bauzanensis TaxID=658167 RepID=A0A1M5TDD4_9BURK|nr:TetR/AcrR family transcriptional regulator [Pollutimonas bauzanensis]SHH48797.1 transcriptional regulator, TetR family [Pollutimonas bauzanensis]
MTIPDEASSTRARLLDTTEQLIYAGGICATGMDLIVKTSGVARKTIYRYYPTKEALVAAALQQRDERWMRWFIGATSDADAPAERLLSMFPALRRWFASDDFRGCAFINAAGEIGGAASPIRAVCRLHKQGLLDYVRQLALACRVDDPEETARQLLVLIDGAITVALVTGDASIADSAERMAGRLIQPRAVAENFPPRQ